MVFGWSAPSFCGEVARLLASLVDGDAERGQSGKIHKQVVDEVFEFTVIVVPDGDHGVPPDETRKPEWYDGIYNYLKNIGIVEI